MKIYNTLGRCKETFEPVNPGIARVYVCGITAYDFCHIGHARSAIVFDILIRRLRLSGLDTLFIRNFTDIDDKIINRANQENRDWRELAETYIKAFKEDMKALNVQEADLEPRATEYMPQIQAICAQLIDKGLAYVTKDGDVYFRVRKYEPYGKLSGRNLDDLRAGARVAIGEEKEDPLDFALWKAAKPGEPSWSSPWGEGRPGWHIECSAMNAPYLPLDIHGGGQDLIFPHHENEIAQSEGVNQVELAKYWMHNGFVRVDSEKMSKSLGNFKTIRDILKEWQPETLRFFLLGKHYRSPIDFNIIAMSEAEKGLRRVYMALKDASEAALSGKWNDKPLPEDISKDWVELDKAFEQALDDDLNTAEAIGHIFSNVRIVNRLLEDKNLRKCRQTGLICNEFIARSHKWSESLGILGQKPGDFLSALRDIRIKRNGINVDEINAILKRRLEARKEKNFKLSDDLRDELAKKGILARDTPAGQVWDFE